MEKHMIDDKNTEAHVEENNKETAKAGEDYRVKASKFENVLAKVLCVLAAVTLWFYVVGTNTTIEEKNFDGVNVVVRGAETIESTLGLSVIGGYDYNVDLTLQGTRSDMSRASADNITAYVDVSGVKAAGEHSLEIKVELPNGVSLVGQSTRRIQVYVDKSVSVSVPVKVETLYSIESTYSMGTPEPSFTTVSVTGPEAELNKIDFARVKLDLGRIDRTLTATGVLELIGKDETVITNPYVKLQNSEVSVRIPVYAYKEVPLVLEYVHGYYNNSNVDITVSPEIVRIKGDPDKVAAVDKIVIPINEKAIDGNSSFTEEIITPTGIENVSGSTYANIKIVHKNTETREVYITNLVVNNPNGLKLTCPEGITVKFRGSKASLDLISSSNVTATIDAASCPKQAGTYEVPVAITVANALKGSVYEISDGGEYTVDVTVG